MTMVHDPASVVDELFQMWDSRDQNRLRADLARIATPGQFLSVWALAFHVRTIAEPAANLIAGGNVLAAMPIVRAVYETALTAQWAALTRTSAQGLMQVWDQSMETLRAELKDAASPTLNANLDDDPKTTREDADRLDAAYAAARKFRTMCDDLMPRGSDKYVYYRFMSQMVHPGVHVIDHYLQSDGTGRGGPDSVLIRSVPRQTNLVEWMGFLSSGVLWAFSALDHLEDGHPNREALRAIGAKIQVTPMLALTPEAVHKYFEEERAVRRSKWKGRKRRDVRDG